MSDLKIICTLGPKSSCFDVLQDMIQATMDMVRINTAHGEVYEHLSRLALLGRVEKKLGKVIKRLLDLKGIDLRLGAFEGAFPLERGDLIWLVPEGEACPEKNLFAFSHPHLLKEVSVGECLRLDSGCLTTEVKSVDTDRVQIEVKNRWVLKEKKGVTLPSFSGTEGLELTVADLRALTVCSKERIDWIALSFVNHPNQVRELKSFLRREGQSHIKIMSKIETETGLNRLQAILSESDAVMFARGDLGAQLEIERLPRLQKEFFALACQNRLPAVLATQLLPSMCARPIPNRSEVTDVFNGVLDGASGLMLSEESAVGDFPVETVTLMRKLIKESTSFALHHSLSLAKTVLD
ncbi:pyruvate kinase [Candidatus Similichlamydia laticola]|uniref:Pyruvate kinase n=1 Tax=Candidatus Similichlamydia laticola TaxID=2170265 RepID=A0A369KFF1_9BACT|nr:pyruvate kinase [Candidatus Similichlamydia laticola]RDB31425.1 Pyruvate kinase [Candidatus Similichlamydia laticola]